MHVGAGYREKSADLQGALKLGGGVIEICTCYQDVFWQQQCHNLKIKEQTATDYRSYSLVYIHARYT